MKEEFTYTLKMFIEDYNGFDLEHGKVIIVNRHTPYICTGQWAYLIEQFKNRGVRSWTHDENTMVITI